MGTLTLMIVENDLQSIYLMERYARRSGCQPVCTTCGENALALARQERPAVIFLDLMLPGISGWEVLQVLKADPVTRPIPVIICSALDEADTSTSLSAGLTAQAAGAASYLRKPIYYQDFLGALGDAGVELPAV